MEYISENHSKHLLMCHLIFVCKYRKKLLLKVGDDIKTESNLYLIVMVGKLSSKK